MSLWSELLVLLSTQREGMLAKEKIMKIFFQNFHL